MDWKQRLAELEGQEVRIYFTSGQNHLTGKVGDAASDHFVLLKNNHRIYVSYSGITYLEDMTAVHQQIRDQHR